MARYIDADEFGKIFKLRQVLLECSAEFNFAIYSSLKNRDKARAKAYARLVKEIINDQSVTADVVEVVRCKDCRYWKEISVEKELLRNSPIQSLGVGECCCKHWKTLRTPKILYIECHETNENDYCSYGERREK